jgi:hypothetical protein
MNPTASASNLESRPWGKVRVIPRPPRWPIPRPIQIITEHIDVCTIGHAFTEIPPEVLFGSSPVYIVSDFLIDQSQSTGGGSALVDPIEFDLTTGHMYVYRLTFCGKTVHVKVPPAIDSVEFSAYLGRQKTGVSTPDVFTPLSVQIHFSSLVGDPPTFTYQNFSLTSKSNEAMIFEVEANVTGSFRFSGLSISGLYGVRTIDPGVKSYDPLSYAVPLGVKDPGSDKETFVMFSYQTTAAKDPGRFVILE